MNKKLELKRLLIYLAFSFGLAYAWFFITNMKFETWQEMSSAKESFIALGMLAPLLAHILTRLVTKEGFKLYGKDSMMFGISFKEKKWIFFVLAILLPWVYIELGNVLTILFFRELYDPEYYLKLEIDKRILYIYPLAAIISGVFSSFAAFGEEAGWRGYMMPKLLKLFGAEGEGKGAFRGKILAVIIGGIIWGLWHAPLTCTGHNFGTDYPGFSFCRNCQNVSLLYFDWNNADLYYRKERFCLACGNNACGFKFGTEHLKRIHQYRSGNQLGNEILQWYLAISCVDCFSSDLLKAFIR